MLDLKISFTKFYNQDGTPKPTRDDAFEFANNLIKARDEMVVDLIKETISRGDVVVGFGWNLTMSKLDVEVFAVKGYEFNEIANEVGLSAAILQFISLYNTKIKGSTINPVWVYVDAETFSGLEETLKEGK